MKKLILLMIVVFVISEGMSLADENYNFLNPIYYLMYGYDYNAEEYEEAEANTLERDFKNCLKNGGGNACYTKYKVNKAQYEKENK